MVRSSGWLGGEAAAVRTYGSEIDTGQLMEASGVVFAESKSRRLDGADGMVSVGEMQPAVADIGMPAQGSSPNAEHVSEAMSEFSHGKQKQDEEPPMSDMAAAVLKKDPIVILRMDGEDLRDFVSGPLYEPEAAAIFSQLVVAQHEDAPPALRRCLLAALAGRLGVHHGMPPVSDPWVSQNVVEPALQQLEHLPPSPDVFSAQLKRILSNAAGRLHEWPVIVAHTEDTFDGSGVRRLLANRFELDKLLDSAWKDVPAEHKKGSRECVRAALDRMADAAGLPHYGVVCQVDAVVNEALKTVTADDGKAAPAVDEAEFKKLLTEVLGAVMLQLDGDPIFVSTSTVVHEPLSNPSAAAMLSPPRPVGGAAE